MRQERWKGREGGEKISKAHHSLHPCPERVP